ncbi:MAG: rRNA pseudouridine synthase [Anaerolineales bacterium]|nr:rRNA pseudouridine synthase [Anaerolineales bacterium]
MEERIQKILARAGIGSRRACEALILQGRVTVNGRRAELGHKADAGRDVLAVDGEPLRAPEKPTYVILNKPRGVVSSLAAQDDRPTVRELVGLEGRLYPVGRLDADSEGLIVLTNDGDLTDHLTHPRYESEKEYRVLVRGTPKAEQLAAWRRGILLAGMQTAPARVVLEKETHGGAWLRVTMREGRKHQIRDIGALLGLPVQRLIRVGMGGLTLGDLPVGGWRELRRDEVRKLRQPGRAPDRVGGRPRPSRAAPARRRPTRKTPR